MVNLSDGLHQHKNFFASSSKRNPKDRVQWLEQPAGMPQAISPDTSQWKLVQPPQSAEVPIEAQPQIYGSRTEVSFLKKIKMLKSLTCRSMLTPDDKEILQKHWIPTILSQEPELFIKTMIEAMKECPKLLDVISCNMRPCPGVDVKILSEWPKLKKISRGNCTFFTRQIVINKLDEAKMRREAEILGPIHLQYAPFGFEPFFLDIWQHNAIALIEKLSFPSDVDKVLFVKAFSTLCTFLCTLMVMEVEDSIQSMLYLEETIKTLNC
ncbi:hypothetical protein QR680_016534 [Steinernema hermaphroditum]|uniref:Uncharacterized protein n=1 Tax=Steinernema hermaphroditum TaxID=289476 RepID=A0AA39HDZ8_9BILA|nr:hypothetical protein QR680_016534 [Steinernema hermaphroditum]